MNTTSEDLLSSRRQRTQSRLLLHWNECHAFFSERVHFSIFCVHLESRRTLRYVLTHVVINIICYDVTSTAHRCMYLQTGGEGEGETAGSGQVVGVSLDPHLWSPVSAEEEFPGADVQGQCD